MNVIRAELSGLTIDRDQATAFRLQGHHLIQRLPSPDNEELIAATACGLQDTPPGSATLALHARVSNLTPADLDRALIVEKTLIQLWSMRAATYLIPTRDAPVFTTGLLPEDEESLRFFILGAGSYLDRFGMSATEAVERTAAALLEVLNQRELTKDELGAELAQRLSRFVAPEQRALWDMPDGMTRYGESLARFAISVVSLQGLFCLAPRRGKAATFIRTDQWLGSPFPEMEPSRARAELVRRYLSCYGPSTPKHFAEWAGIAPAQARRAWQLVAAEQVEVKFSGRRAWLNRADLLRLDTLPQPEGVRFLPPHDPYLAQRDRETLLPDKARHPLFWRSAGNPGAILAQGRIVAAWRPEKKGRLLIKVIPLEPLSGETRAQIEAEAMTLAPFRGSPTVTVEFEASPV